YGSHNNTSGVVRYQRPVIRVNATCSRASFVASTDCTVMIQSPSPEHMKSPPTITHSTAVRCLLPLALTPLSQPYLLTGAGDVITVWDVSSFGERDAEVEKV